MTCQLEYHNEGPTYLLMPNIGGMGDGMPQKCLVSSQDTLDDMEAKGLSEQRMNQDALQLSNFAITHCNIAAI
jgi:hypothetical protein